MALGIDIYRYQTVTNWSAVKGHGVSFVYVKGTDGGGPAQARADGQVRGAQSVQLPVGLYHYAQLAPSPEAQADVLTGEVRRLGATGLSPALDLEDPFRPNANARQFVERFLNKLRANGFSAVTLYANTSMLTGINADTLTIPGLRIWAANYGPNNGRRNPLSYRGRVDIHQYTSVGRVPGITGSVDLNESLTTEDDDMYVDDISDAAADKIAARAYWGIRFVGDENFATIEAQNRAKIDAIAQALAQDQGNDLTVAQIDQLVRKAIAETAGPPTAVTVDPAVLTEGLTKAIEQMTDDALARIANAAADEQDRRARERLLEQETTS